MQSILHLCSILHDFNWQCACTASSAISWASCCSKEELPFLFLPLNKSCLHSVSRIKLLVFDDAYSCTTSVRMSTVVLHHQLVVQCQCLHISGLRHLFASSHACCGDKVHAIWLRISCQCLSFRPSIGLVLTTLAAFRLQVLSAQYFSGDLVV